MILVDTSVLIDAFSGSRNEEVEKLRSCLENGVSVGINNYVYLEVLQGAKNEIGFQRLKEYLNVQRFYTLKYGERSYESAAMIFYKCKTTGNTVSSTIDCLIAQTAIEHDLRLLHRDRDFERMAKVVPLKLF